MNKATSTLIAAVAALALSGGAYAQTAGNSGGVSSNPGSAPVPATNQMNDATSGYGMPGATNSDAGMGTTPPNSPQQQSTNTSTAPHTSGPKSGPKSNNSLATPSVVSPADQ